MNVLNRAILSIKRNKKQSILLFLIFFSLSLCLNISFIINKNSKTVEENIKKNLGAVATIAINYDFVENEIEEDKLENNYLILDNEIIESVGRSKYVEEFDYNIITMYNTKNLETVNSTKEVLKNEIKFKGVNDLEILDIEDNKIKLIEGELLSEIDIQNNIGKAIISDKLAEKNNLKVKDTFIIDVYVEQLGIDIQDSEVLKIPIEVCGIFSLDKLTINSKKNISLIDEQLNTIYLTNNFVEKYNIEYYKIYNNLNPGIYTNQDGSKMDDEEIKKLINVGMPIYKMKDSESLEYFIEESKPKINSKYFKILTTNDQYSRISGNIISWTMISKKIIIGSFVTIFIVTGLSTLLIIITRIKEIYILLALGERKIKVWLQFLIEVCTVLFFSISMAATSGILIEDKISNFIFKDTIEISNKLTDSEEENVILDAISEKNISNTDINNFHDYKIKFKEYIIVLIVMNIAIICVSSLCLCLLFFIKPKKMLTK